MNFLPAQSRDLAGTLASQGEQSDDGCKMIVAKVGPYSHRPLLKQPSAKLPTTAWVSALPEFARRQRGDREASVWDGAATIPTRYRLRKLTARQSATNVLNLSLWQCTVALALTSYQTDNAVRTLN